MIRDMRELSYYYYREFYFQELLRVISHSSIWNELFGDNLEEFCVADESILWGF